MQITSRNQGDNLVEQVFTEGKFEAYRAAGEFVSEQITFKLKGTYYFFKHNGSSWRLTSTEGWGGSQRVHGPATDASGFVLTAMDQVEYLNDISRDSY